MKKQYLVLLSSLFVLTACKSQTSKPTESTTTQTTVSTTTTSSTKATSTKEQPTTTKVASETKQETTTQEAKKATVQNKTTVASTSMNIEEIKGTWRNDYGQELTFHENGTVSVKDSTYKVQPTQTQYQDGLLNWIFSPLENQPTVGSAIMTFVPKNQVVTYGLIEGNKDTSDTTKDRLFGTQSALTSDALKKAMYYKVSE